MYVCRLKIFIPPLVLIWAILVYVNWTSETLDKLKGESTYSEIDKLYILNIPQGSHRQENDTPISIYCFNFSLLMVLQFKISIEWDSTSFLRLLSMMKMWRSFSSFVVLFHWHQSALYACQTIYKIVVFFILLFQIRVYSMPFTISYHLIRHALL